MLRKFFIWKAERRMGRTTYRFDRRRYHGIFQPGLRAHLQKTQFWQTDNDPYHRSRRRRKRIQLAGLALVLIAIVWLALESSRALRLF